MKPIGGIDPTITMKMAMDSVEEHVARYLNLNNRPSDRKTVRAAIANALVYNIVIEEILNQLDYLLTLQEPV